METEKKTAKKIMLLLFKDFSTHTVTSIAKKLQLSRVGAWKILKKLESDKCIKLESVGSGKTSTFIIRINWDNILVDKSINLYLTEEALKQKRWRVNFVELESVVDFIILHGSILFYPQQANDIDIIIITKKKNFVKIQKILDKIQKTQSKKIHAISFTENEFRKEMQKPNKAFIDSIKKGVILFGQENFIEFIKKIK